MHVADIFPHILACSLLLYMTVVNGRIWDFLWCACMCVSYQIISATDETFAFLPLRTVERQSAISREAWDVGLDLWATHLIRGGGSCWEWIA